MSQVLFKSALGLAKNRGLLDDDATTESRHAFADQIRNVIGQMDQHL